MKGAGWWTTPAVSGPVLSGSQWQWDIYWGRHHELMNGNPDKVLTGGDAWNDEDLSAVRLDDAGNATLRQDARLLDRVYPSATSGTTVAFTYEDRSRDGSTTLTWNPVPSFPAHHEAARRLRPVRAARVALDRRRGTHRTAPARLLPDRHDHRRLRPRGRVRAPGLHGHHEDRGGRRTGRHGQPASAAHARPTRARLHYALVTNGASAPSAAQLAAARTELAAWVAQKVG